MQIEKHIKIVPTPTGGTVFFAGQVCLTIIESAGRFVWNISPVFAKLTTGVSTFRDVPSSWTSHPTMAEAIADGLTKLDEMKAFYGVIDMPEDTYVGEHLSEEADESIDDILAESFIVRQVGQSRNHPPRIMISAAAVINRAREMAKEAGEKSHPKFLKLAHAEIASNMKAESEEIEGDQIEEGLVDNIKRGVKSVKRGMQGWDKNSVGPGGEKPGDPKDIVRRNKGYDDDTLRRLGKTSNFGFPFGKDAKTGDKTPRGLQRKVIDREMKKRGLSNEEFVQYEDALPGAFQAIKEDCRAEALAMSDSLVEAQQLANELFENIVEEYLDEDYDSWHKKELEKSRTRHPEGFGNKPSKTMERLHKIPGFAKTPQEEKNRVAKAVDHHMSRDLTFDQALVLAHKKNESVEDLGEATHQDLLDGAQKAYVEATRKGNAVMARHYGQEVLKHKANIAAIGVRAKKSKLKEEVELDEAKIPFKIGAKVKRKDNGKNGVVHSITSDGNSVNVTWAQGSRVPQAVHKLNLKIANEHEEVELDEAALSGDAYWKSKEAESKEEFLKAQRKALGLPEPVKRGRGKPTLIDRDSLKSRAHSNVEAGKRPTAGFDRNEKIHFVRHLKNHPDFADKHVSQAGRPTGTTKVAKVQKELAKKKQDTAFSMWAGLGKR